MTFADSVVTGITVAIFSGVYQRISNYLFFKHLDEYLDRRLNHKKKRERGSK